MIPKYILIGAALGLIVEYLSASFILWNWLWAASAGEWTTEDRIWAIYAMVASSLIGAWIGAWIGACPLLKIKKST